MTVKLQSFETGPLGVNCYIVADSDSKEGIVIDAGGNADQLLRYIKAEGIHIQVLLNTHGHGDHIGAVDALRDALKVPLLMHAADQPMLGDAKKNLSAFMGFPVTARPAEGTLEDGQRISAGALSFEVLHTPGHSPGGICLLGMGMLFSGDSLFAESIGRCDFPGASQTQLLVSLQQKVMILPDAIRVYPGHGPDTSIAWERRHNLYLQQ